MAEDIVWDEPKDGIVWDEKPNETKTVDYSNKNIPPQSAMDKFLAGAGSYLQNAQPAFKWALGGMPQDLQSINEVTQGDYSDLYRRAGLPFSKSTSTMGQLVPQIAGEVIDIASRPSSYILPKVIGGMVKGNKFPEIMGKDYTYDRAVKSAKGLDAIRTSLGEAKKAVIDKLKDSPIKNFNTEFPEYVLSKLKDSIYGIEFDVYGNIRKTVGNLDKVLDALGDQMTGKGWNEASKRVQQVIKQEYGRVAKAMRSAYPELSEPINAYSDFMKKYGLVNKTVRDSLGNIKEGTFLSAINREGASAKETFEAWKSLSKKNPDIAQAVKDMEKFIGRQHTKKIIKTAMPWIVGSVVGTGVLGYGITKALEK